MANLRRRRSLFPFLLILFFYFFLSSSSSPIPDDGFASHSHPHQQLPSIPGFRERKLQTAESPTEASNSSAILILAANRTRRKDPLNDFKYYEGGWNITNPHYLYSVGYSAAPPIIVAMFWFIFFGMYLCCVCIWRCCCCGRLKPHGYSQAAYIASLVFLILITVTAIVGSIILFEGQAEFEMSIADIISYILHKADYVIETLQSVFNYLLSAKNVGIGPLTLPPDLLGTIEYTQNNINAIADNLHKVTGASSEDISNLLTPLRIPLIHVTAFMLALVIIGFISSLGGLQCLIYFLLVVGWIAVTFVFVASGLFVLVHNAVEDTCVAMDDWLLNPNAHSALESIIPKADNQTASTILMDTKQITFALVNETNTAITNVFNADLQPSDVPLYFNQTGPKVPVLCMPLNANLTEVPCLTGEVDFTNASQVWKGYVCEVSSSGMCITPGRITPDAYTELISSLNVSYALYEYGSFLVDLVDSTYVKETFMDISNNFCPTLRHSTKLMCVGFIMVAAASMLSLMSWLSYGRERRRRKYAMKRMNQFPPPPPLPPPGYYFGGHGKY